MKKVLYILKILKLNIKTILIFTLLGGLFSFTVTEYLIPKRYTSSVTMWVGYQRPVMSIDNAFYLEQELFSTYFVIIKSKQVLQQVSDELINNNLYYDIDSLRSFLKFKKTEKTELFEVLVTTKDKFASKTIADAIMKFAPDEIKRVVKAERVEIVEPAYFPEKPSFPNLPLFTLIGALISLIISSTVIIIKNSKVT